MGLGRPFATLLDMDLTYPPDAEAFRLEIRQWLREDYVAPSENGWGEALTKLDAALAA